MYYVLLFVVVTPLSLSVGTNCTIANQEYVCGALVCNASTNQCISCSSDSQCMNRNHKCDNGVCSLKPLVDTINGAFWIAPLGAIILSAVALAGGMGGGGVLVPFYLIVMNLSLIQSIAVSQVTIMGQSLIGVLFRMRQKHPFYSEICGTKRPLINYPYLTLLFPFIIVGSILGALVGRTIPDWLRVSLTIILYLIMFIRGFRKAYKQFKEHQKLKLAPYTDVDISSDVSSLNDEEKEKIKEQYLEEIQYYSEASTDHDNTDTLGKGPITNINEFQVPKYYLFELVMCIVMFVILVIGSLLRTYIFKCGSAPFFIAVAIPIALLIVCFIVVRNRYANKQREMGTKIANPVIPFAWSTKITVIFPILSWMAGAVASMLGGGSGAIITAILFETGMDPSEATATGTLNVMIATVASTSLFLISGLLPYDYAGLFLCVGFIGSIIGKFAIINPIKKYGLNFLIFVFWLIMIGSSLISQSIWGITSTIRSISNGGSLNFNSLCSK